MKSRSILLLAAASFVAACLDGEPSGVPPETAHFDATGGEHVFDNGLKLIVPPGALSGGADISLRDLEPEEMETLLEIRSIPRSSVLFAFEAAPDGIVFAAPVQVVVPVEALTAAMIPLISELDLPARSASVADLSYVANPFDKTITLSLTHFSGYAGEIEDEIHRNECDDPNTSCRCGQIHVSQADYDASCSVQDCQVVYSENRVRFLDCPDQPEESSIFEEVSTGCAPTLSVSAAERFLAMGEHTEVTAALRLGCVTALPDRTVSFVASGPGTVSPGSDVTDDQGIAATTLTAGGEEGTITITGNTTLEYVVKRINVNGEDLVRDTRTADLASDTNVDVIDKPVLELTALDDVIFTGDWTEVVATIADSQGPVEGQVVEFAVTGPAELFPISAATDGSGVAATTLFPDGTEGTATVTADSTVTVTLPSGEEAAVPLTATASVLILEEPDYDGSVWRFEYVSEYTASYGPQGCEDIYVAQDCSCVGDYSNVLHEETTREQVTGELTVTHDTPYSYAVSFANVSGSLTVSRPSSEYAETCPLGGGLGGAGCVCEDPSYTRTDAFGDDAVDESRSLFWASPSTEEIEGDLYGGGHLWIACHGPATQDYIEQRSWHSTLSTCTCLGWDGTRIYDTWPRWGFGSWIWDEVPLRNDAWTEVWGDGSRHSYSLTCIENCNF